MFNSKKKTADVNFGLGLLDDPLSRRLRLAVISVVGACKYSVISYYAMFFFTVDSKIFVKVNFKWNLGRGGI